MQPSGGDGSRWGKGQNRGCARWGGGISYDDGMDGWINITIYKIAPPETPNRKYSNQIFFFSNQIIMENDGKAGVLLYLKLAQLRQD